MKCYIVTYDLKRGGPFNYEELYKTIKAYPGWAHINESVWAILTEESAVAVRDALKLKMDSGDSIFVVKSGVEAAWSRVKCRNEWLKENL